MSDPSGGVGVTPGYSPSQVDRNLEGFRFGLTFGYPQIAELRDRDPVAHFLTSGITKEALGDGFVINDSEGNEISNWSDWETFLADSKFLENFMKFISDIRAFGSAGGLIFGNGELKSFEPKTIEIFFNGTTRVMTQVICHEFFSFSNIQEIPHKIKLVNDPEIDPFIYGLIEQGSKTFEGKSVLEKVWDIINALWIIDFMAAMYAARVGAGLKIVKAGTESKEEKDVILTDLRDLSWKGGIVIDLEDDFQLYTGEGSIDFEKLKNILYDSLASATGIPKTKWRGEVPGELSAGKINRTSYIEQTTGIQDDSQFYLRFFLKIISGMQSIPLEEGFNPSWNYKEEPTEREKSEIQLIKANAVTVTGNFMTGAEIRKEFELDDLEFFQSTEQIPLNILIAKNNSKIAISLGESEENVSKSTGPDSGPESEQDESNNSEVTESDTTNGPDSGSESEPATA